MMWAAWKKKWIDARGRHVLRQTWKVTGVWELVRDDGLATAHKAESPYPTWCATIEESMRLADENIPLGAELPEGMGNREDPDYSPLWP